MYYTYLVWLMITGMIISIVVNLWEILLSDYNSTYLLYFSCFYFLHSHSESILVSIYFHKLISYKLKYFTNISYIYWAMTPDIGQFISIWLNWNVRELILLQNNMSLISWLQSLSFYYCSINCIKWLHT